MSKATKTECRDAYLRTTLSWRVTSDGLDFVSITPDSLEILELGDGVELTFSVDAAPRRRNGASRRVAVTLRTDRVYPWELARLREALRVLASQDEKRAHLTRNIAGPEPEKA